MGTTLLQAFLLITVFVIGVLSCYALQHGLAHYYPRPEPDDRSQPPVKIQLPPNVKERLLQQSQASFQAVLDKSAINLEHDLQKTAGELNSVLQRIGAQVVGNEMERYRVQLDEIRQQATAAIGTAQAEINQHQADLKAKLNTEEAEVRAKLAAEITAEKQRAVQDILTEKQHLLQQIDTKLADAVASFLLESLGHNVDLGAQQAYLTAQLEAHKDDFKRSVSE